MGIYLHDIGMQCDVVRFPKIEEKAERLGANFNCTFSSEVASCYSLEEQRDIHKNHQFLTAAWIDYSFLTGDTILGQAIKTIPEELISDLIDVCKYHSGLPITECPQEFKFDPKGRKQLSRGDFAYCR